MNFEVVAFENSFTESHLVNKLLTDPAYSTKQITDSLFGRIHETYEMNTFLDIVRKKNLQNPQKPIYVEGFDDQNHYFLGFTLANDFEGIDSVIYNTVFEIRNMKGVIGVTQYDAMHKKAAMLIDYFDKTKSELKKKYINLDTLLLEKKLRSYSNSLYLKFLYAKTNLEKKAYDVPNTYRDSLMADNVMWLKRYYKNKKIIILCHNDHIQKNSKGSSGGQTPQGHFLQNSFPNGDYKSFAFLTAEGNMTSYKSNSMPEMVPLFSPYKSCYEYYFAKMPDSIFYFPLFKSKNSNKHKNITKGLRIRDSGYGTSIDYDPFKEIDLLGGFDGVFFIRKTSPSASFWYKN